MPKKSKDNISFEIEEKTTKRGRPTKYATEEEKAFRKREQTLASNKRRREEKKKATAEGEGMITDAIRNVREYGLVKGLKETGKDKLHQAKAIITGNITQLSPAIKTLLNKYGDVSITSAMIQRAPVSGVLTGALSLFSGGKFGERQKERDFDELFHLSMVLTLSNGKKIQLEKEARINIRLKPPTKPHTETEDIKNLPTGLTLNSMLEKTKAYIGDKKFYGYSAKDNNCQDFLVSVLKANDIGGADDLRFIKQDTQYLFKNLSGLRKLSNTLTDIGARADVFMEGGDIKKQYEGEVEALRNKKMNSKRKLNMLSKLQEHYYKLLREAQMKGGMLNFDDEVDDDPNADGFATPPEAIIHPLNTEEVRDLVRILRGSLSSSNHRRFLNLHNPPIMRTNLVDTLGQIYPPPEVARIMARYDQFRAYIPPPVVSPEGSDAGFESDDASFEDPNNVVSSDDEMDGRGIKEDDIDFDDMKWGSFTEQFNRFRKKHKKSPIKDLEQFAKMLIENKEKYHKTTIKRARFYLNVLLPKKNKISTNTIKMVKKLTKKQMKALEKETDGEGLYVSGIGGDGLYAGEGMYAGEGFSAGQGCPSCGMSGGAISLPGGAVALPFHHSLIDEIEGGNIFKSAGRWFRKAGRTINKAVIKPIAKEFSKKGKIQGAVDKAFSKGGVAEKLGRKAFREGVPVLTGALGGLAGSFAGGPAGSLAGSYGGAKGGEELVKMSGVGVKKRSSSWIDAVKAVQKRDGCSYKEALSRASAERKK